MREPSFEFIRLSADSEAADELFGGNVGSGTPNGGDQVSVDAEAVRAVVARLSDVREGLEEGLRTTTRGVQDLIDGVWKGDASGRFNVNFDEFLEAATKILQDASAIEALVVEGMTEYERSDQSNSASFQATSKLNL